MYISKKNITMCRESSASMENINFHVKRYFNEVKLNIT